MSTQPVNETNVPPKRGSSVANIVRSAIGSVSQVIFAAVIGLAIGAVMMTVAGYDWKLAYEALWLGSFGDTWGFADTIADATPLILTGLTFGLCFRAGYFNIGAQGQMTVGALAAVAVGAYVKAPAPIAILLVIVTAGVVGALWSLPAAYLKATRGVHEVISTIMFNWIAFYLALYMVFNVLNDPRSAERTLRVHENVRLGAIVPGADATWAILISLVVAGGLYWLLWHSPWGYEMRVAGFNANALRYAGASPIWGVNFTFILAGIAAGIAGATQIIGRPPTYALYGDLSNLGDLGFDGIAVALIGRNHPIGTIAAAVFFGALSTGARMMQIMAGVPLHLIRIVHGVVIVALAAPEAWSIIRTHFRLMRAANRSTGTVTGSVHQ